MLVMTRNKVFRIHQNFMQFYPIIDKNCSSPMGVPTVHMATTSSSSRQRPEARAMAEAARTMKVFMMWRRTELVTADTTMALYLSG